MTPEIKITFDQDGLEEELSQEELQEIAKSIARLFVNQMPTDLDQKYDSLFDTNVTSTSLH